jgi:hypothetical protein
MNTAQFNRVLRERLEETQKRLGAKAAEYARGDRLSNFKAIAAAQKLSPEKVCMTLMSKHWTALTDAVNDLSGEPSMLASPHFFDEKIGDIVAYLVLLDALIQERREWLEKEWVSQEGESPRTVPVREFKEQYVDMEG